MTQKNLFVVAVVESGVVTSVYAPDGTPVDYDIVDHDEISHADEARLRGLRKRSCISPAWSGRPDGR